MVEAFLFTRAGAKGHTYNVRECGGPLLGTVTRHVVTMSQTRWSWTAEDGHSDGVKWPTRGLAAGHLCDYMTKVKPARTPPAQSSALERVRALIQHNVSPNRHATLDAALLSLVAEVRAGVAQEVDDYAAEWDRNSGEVRPGSIIRGVATRIRARKG